MKEQVNHLKRILPQDYQVIQDKENNRIICSSLQGINDEERWHYTYESIKRNLGENFQYLVRENNKCFAIYITEPYYKVKNDYSRFEEGEEFVRKYTKKQVDVNSEELTDNVYSYISQIHFDAFISEVLARHLNKAPTVEDFLSTIKVIGSNGEKLLLYNGKSIGEVIFKKSIDGVSYEFVPNN